ncbi:MAG: decaprenyl-phosphate phosphoribosyltransferase [Candidatus Levybacteria bacterium]|nr:decaprenyl-phosphate phosphoribosyltransferase [Candidatus Levybacteria bacterium]
MKKSLRNYIRLLRPRQWIKNLAIFASITFTGQLFNEIALPKVIFGFVVFCGISSAIYVINDIFDIKKDRLHPFKRFRPLANGDIPIQIGILIAVGLTFLSVLWSYFIDPAFFLITLIYLFLQLSYSMILKNIAVIDILALAGGYILRVYAGEIMSGYHISVWLLLTTISLSLFLAIGKRRNELTLISQYTSAQIAATRKSLSHYSERLLDVYASIFATSTFISYALFAFFENSRNTSSFTNPLLLPEYLPDYLSDRKWLMVTIIPVVYGLMRYLQDIYEKHEGESPEKVLLSDKPLLSTVIIWVLLVLFIIYFIGV